MNLTTPSSSKMDGENIRNCINDKTYVIFRFEDQSMYPVPVTWVVEDLTSEYNECCWPEHLSTFQILTAIRNYSNKRKETWPRFKGIILDVYLDYKEASKACVQFKKTETNIKHELQIEHYFKSQSYRFRNAEKNERNKFNKISKSTQEGSNSCARPSRKRTSEDIAQIGLQADLQAYIKKVEEKRSNIDIHKDKVEENKIPNNITEQVENKKETNYFESKVNKQSERVIKSPNTSVSSNCCDAFISQLKELKENINQCESHFNSFIKGCEPLQTKNSKIATSNEGEINAKKSKKDVNIGICLEHEKMLCLRCSTHKAWVCDDCCENDHPKNECNIINFEEELIVRKNNEVQRLQEESQKVSVIVTSIFEMGNKKERERNNNIQKLNEMQKVMQKMICDIDNLRKEMAYLNEVMSEGKEIQHKLNEKKDDITSTMSISQLSSITKSNSDIIVESKNWCEKLKKKMKIQRVGCQMLLYKNSRF